MESTVGAEIARLRSKFTHEQLIRFQAQLPADPTGDTPQIAQMRTVLALMAEEEDGPVSKRMMAMAAGVEAGDDRQVRRAARHCRQTVRACARKHVDAANAELEADECAREWAALMQSSGRRLAQLADELSVARSGLCETTGIETVKTLVFQLVAMRVQLRDVSTEMRKAPGERAQQLFMGSRELIGKVEALLELFELPAELSRQTKAAVAQKRDLADAMLRGAIESSKMYRRVKATATQTEAAVTGLRESALAQMSSVLGSANAELVATPALLRTTRRERRQLEQERETAALVSQREGVAQRALQLHADAVAAQEEATACEEYAVELMNAAMGRGAKGKAASDAAVAAANRAHALAHAKAEPLLEEAITAAEEAAGWDTRVADALLRDATRARDFDELSGLLRECGHAASPEVQEAAQKVRQALQQMAHGKDGNGACHAAAPVRAVYAY